MAGLYLHTPFCRQKCNYCDFFSTVPIQNQLETWHLLLQKNLQLIAEDQPTEIESIFWGGGTPSLLTPEQISNVLNCCQQCFTINSDSEISLEANPGTLNRNSLKGYQAAGINRLSLGVQSFDNQALTLMGRIHSAEQAISAFKLGRDIGFTNISIDLIFALPGQEVRDLERDIDKLIQLSPDHIGIYGLSIESGTPLCKSIDKGEITESDEDLYAQQYLTLNRRLTKAGYEHYEISNFAKPGSRCRHNQLYWQRKNCLAAGAGAHAYNNLGYGRRTVIPADLSLYQQQLAADKNPAELLEEFNKQQAMAETLYLALRTSDGIDRNLFTENFGIEPEVAFPKAFKALESRLILKDNCYSFTVEDWLVYDHLISKFL